MSNAARVTRPTGRPPIGTGRSLSDQAYERVKALILDGTFRPNQKLTEDDLAGDLEISRTPIRTALLRLVDQGLVRRAKHGWVVHEPTPAEVQDIYEVRCALEGMATGLAAVRASAQQLTDIAALYDRPMDELLDLPSSVLGEMNREFHEAIVTACGNQRLIADWRRSREFNITYGMARSFTREELAMCIRGHWAIVEALRARDQVVAEESARRHVLEVQGTALPKLTA
ncbi:GntR family transcriptional regulator [Nocardia sp. NPDC127579]|uniref:GntR family transcriptional regulator n=1 Tax=Nocardia sp. NPDC127579 TaxID=3345402 RepID=UPI00363930DA